MFALSVALCACSDSATDDKGAGGVGGTAGAGGSGGASACSVIYDNTYDATTSCDIPPERPNWGTLSWEGNLPAGTSIELSLFSADQLDDLDSQVPITHSFDDTTVTPVTIDVGAALDAAPTMTNYLIYLRVRVCAGDSPDGLRTPTLDDLNLVWDCAPLE